MGQPGVCSPLTPPECLPCRPLLSGHSINVGPLMDHLPSNICIFSLSVIGRWKALSSCWKNSRHLLKVGGGGYVGPKGEGPRPLSSLANCPQEWTVGERAEGSLRWFPRRGLFVCLFVCLFCLAGKKRPGQLYLKHNNNDFLEPLALS